MNLFKILVSLLSIISFCFSMELVQKDLNENNFSINKGSFKITEFDKMIKNIKVSNEANIEIDFIDDNTKPLHAIKIFAKEVGTGNILVTFVDNTTMHININIVENLLNIIAVAEQISPNIEITQTNGKVILKGSVQNQKEKAKILDLFEKAGIDLTKDLVDLLNLENPDKMIRIKLYAVEINNNKGLDLKNNWIVSSKNYTENINTDGLYFNRGINNENLSNAQRNILVSDAIDQKMASAVTLTGGLTGAANYLGRYFNTALTLNYLSSKGVASILDETTLLTLEDQDATFHAGGTIYLKISTTTSQGVPTTEVRNINYGLQLDIRAKNIVNNDYVSLDINTKSTQIDWANTVDGIPSFTEKSIKTNVIVGNQSTIVLGGLISSSTSQDVDKIPLLGDIPILGALFTSKAFREGKSELVFFITPEIVDPKNNNQIEKLNNKSSFTKGLEVNQQEQQIEEKPKVIIQEKAVTTPTETDSRTEHEKRVKEILGN
ncbi:MAG: type II and III secretion system protein [Aliarcobacter sp.]|nr:type II and III secretion system protein [Aliarcobacter sp.]